MDNETVSLFARVSLKVGRMLSVERHPHADKLYVESVDMGEERPRTVISGLVNYLSIEEIRDKLCIFVSNLKPVPMRGIVSEAMIFVCTEEETGRIELVQPPEGSVPGDKVTILDREVSIVSDTVLPPKKKIFETVQPFLGIDPQTRSVTLDKTNVLGIKNKGPLFVSTITKGRLS